MCLKQLRQKAARREMIVRIAKEKKALMLTACHVGGDIAHACTNAMVRKANIFLRVRSLHVFIQ